MCLICGNAVKNIDDERCSICGADSIDFEYSGIRGKLKRVYSQGIFTAICEAVYETHFDWKYKVDTKGTVTLSGAYHKHWERLKSYNVYYSPTYFSTLNHVFKLLPIDPSQSTLLDYGSGKGRVIMYALLNNYKRVIGVEFSKELCELSTKNLGKLEKIKKTEYNYEIKNIDASYYSISEDVNVIFMFNPFSGPVFDSVMNEVSSFAKGKEVYLVYLNIKQPVSNKFVVYRQISEKSAIFRMKK